MKQVMTWVKEHVLVVVFCGVVIAALVGGFFGSASFNETVRLKAEEQALRYGELARVENGSITISLPGLTEPFTGKGVINDAVVQQYSRAIVVISEDATKIQRAALQRNLNRREGFDPKSPVAQFLPQVNAEKASLLRYSAQKFFAAEYARLLEEVHAGAAPSNTEVMKLLEASRLNFINQDLRKSDAASLTPEEQSKLDQRLATNRIGLIETAALALSFYCDPRELGIPSEAAAKALSLDSKDLGTYEQTLFDWQWRFWIMEDLLHGFYAANQAGAKELVPEIRAPVKRILSIDIAPFAKGGSANAEGGSSENASSGSAASFGASEPPAEGAPTEGAPATVVARAALGSPNIDATAEAPRDYSKSFTGRTSNSVYDVRRVTVVFVAETAAIPTVLDALSKENFMTVLDMSVARADPFAAAVQGFAYGVEPVSLVTIELETVWFREWTAHFMPESVRGVLGITSIAATAPEASEAAAGS
ncbi:MAG: hypothetical protein EXS10_09815 [Phycisphaerales bacterium]|nr:hypothetical protein [Phycisphaerales bacterium]